MLDIPVVPVEVCFREAEYIGVGCLGRHAYLTGILDIVVVRDAINVAVDYLAVFLVFVV